jgi:hypothetical protein
MLVLGGVITFLYGILLAHVLAMFRFSVKAGAFLMIDAGRRINPDLTIASAGCRSHCCNWTLGAVHTRTKMHRNEPKSDRELAGKTFRCYADFGVVAKCARREKPHCRSVLRANEPCLAFSLPIR